jgi:peptidoglycan-N-acetylglucosamine deacetylase
MRGCLGVATTLTILVGGMSFATSTPAQGLPEASANQTARCSRGLVALTFDDGPRPATTRPIVRVLIRKKAPATFFVVGQRISGNARLLNQMRRHGMRFGNHSYRHEKLTSLSNREIRRTLQRTNRAIRHAGLGRTRLMRPPYGAINSRVRRVVRHMNMTPVLWDIDSRDWDGRSAREIVSTVLAGLDPGRHNVVLLHDGVANSDRTLAALPPLIKRIRGRGYCLAALNRYGVPQPPVPKTRVSGDTVREKGRKQPVFLRFNVRLSKPTSRPASVRVRTRAKSATPHRDFVPRNFRLRFPAGTTHRVVRVKVLGNARDERRERLRLVLSHPRHLRIADGSARGTIRDDD